MTTKNNQSVSWESRTVTRYSQILKKLTRAKESWWNCWSPAWRRSTRSVTAGVKQPKNVRRRSLSWAFRWDLSYCQYQVNSDTTINVARNPDIMSWSMSAAHIQYPKTLKANEWPCQWEIQFKRLSCYTIGPWIPPRFVVSKLGWRRWKVVGNVFLSWNDVEKKKTRHETRKKIARSGQFFLSLFNVKKNKQKTEQSSGKCLAWVWLR